MHLLHKTSLVFLMSIAFIGCSSHVADDVAEKTTTKSDIRYFALEDDFQTTANESTKANSIVVGKIDTSEIYMRPMSSDGMPQPCDILREGQLIEENTGRSFPVSVDFRTGLFSALKDADGLTVKIHVIDKVIDDSFRIGHDNVTAIQWVR